MSESDDFPGSIDRNHERECDVCGETLMTGRDHEWVSVSRFPRDGAPEYVARMHVDCVDEAAEEGWR